MQPGAWTDSLVHTDDGSVWVLASQDKWDKMKGQLDWLEEEVKKEGLECKK